MRGLRAIFWGLAVFIAWTMFCAAMNAPGWTALAGVGVSGFVFGYKYGAGK